MRRSTRPVALLTIAALGLCAGAPRPVLAASFPRLQAAGAVSSASDPPESASAAELTRQARERFKARDYDAAVRLFEQAHALDPNPNYLFNIGRVYEEKRDLRSAIDHYERFVADPAVESGAREQAMQRLRVLKAVLNDTAPRPADPVGPADDTATAPAPVDPTPPNEGPDPVEPTPTPVASAAPEPAPQPLRSSLDPAPARRSDPARSMRLGGYALLGAGGVGLVLGGVFGGLALAKRNEQGASHIVEDRQSIGHTGKTFAVVADVGLFAGAALAVTGLVLVLVARKRGPSRSALLPGVGRGHASLTWSLRF